MRIAWTAPLSDLPEGPLVADEKRLFVATRDGGIRALDLATGQPMWQLPDRPARLAATEGALVLRQLSGTVLSLQPKDGATRWSVDSGVAGDLPPLIDGDRVHVAGRGMTALDLATGKVLWQAADGAETTAPPAPGGARVLVGEGDGTLRSRQRDTGASVWMFQTASALAAPALFDGQQRVFLGTTDRRIVALRADNGEQVWRWKVGNDVQGPGLLFRNRVVFAGFDAVLYALDRGNGNLAWRAPLPSRPIGGPILVGEAALLACRETEVLGYDLVTGKPLGGLRATAEIRTAPLVIGRRLFLGLRDRTVVALDLGVSPAP